MSPARQRRTLWPLRLAGIVLTAVVGLYLVVVAAVWAFQRDLLYFPDPRAFAPDPAGPPIQVVRLTTPDSQSLVGWWLPPAAGKPTLLFFGGNGDSLIGETVRFQACANAGVGLLAVAYEGYSGSTGHPTEAGLHRDGEAAYAWLAQRVAAKDIVIEGYSLGTGVAVPLAAGHPVRALVLEAPYTSTVDVGAARMPFLPVRLLMWDRFQSRDWIGRVHAPLLVVHGDQDTTIPIRFGRGLFALASPPKTFVEVPGGTHENLMSLGLYPRVWAFLGVSSAAGDGAIAPAPSLRPEPARS